MVRLSFKVYCFDYLVFVCCKRGSFYSGVGYGSTIEEAMRCMTFYRV